MNKLEELNNFCTESMIGLLGIKFTGFNSTNIWATMPVNKNTIQPNGFLHGGASLALAESIAGAGSYLLIDRDKYNAFGLQISANHISTIKSGILTANAKIIHMGKTTHIWDIKITGENNKLISAIRVTNMITEKLRKED